MNMLDLAQEAMLLPPNREVRDERKVKAWRTASRVTLALLFALSALQYYFLDVSLTILSLRGVTVFVAY